MATRVVSNPFPRTAVIGGVVIVALALVAATLGRVAGVGSGPVLGTTETVASRELRFEDLGGGRAVIRDAADGAVVAELQPGTENFIRGVMRGIARERRAHGIGVEPPVVLTMDAAGNVALGDPSTGRTIYLNAFGPTNRDSFARLLVLNREERR
jgi:putative photosynthetic complex assembly protein